jgi:hypothetical protein
MIQYFGTAMTLSYRRLNFEFLAICTVLQLSACGGKSNSDAQQGSADATGGTPVVTGSGGTTSGAFASGGAADATGGMSLVDGSGGTDASTYVDTNGMLAGSGGATGAGLTTTGYSVAGSGGATGAGLTTTGYSVAGTGAATSTHSETGGVYGTTTWGSGGVASMTGGVSAIGYGGVAGFAATAVGGSSARCANVTCPSIPNSCRRLVQDPNSCCPTCLDTGCDACPELTCDAGTHSEVATGACCPTCVDDPLDPCVSDQKAYANMCASMLEKYSYNGCSNSSDCTLVVEDNACAFACNIPLPTSTARYFTDNPTIMCSTCPAPTRVPCENQVPACVNKKCVAVAAP